MSSSQEENITELRLQKFQIHNKLTVKFDPEITTITGPSESGKTSLFRAMRWVTHNRPTSSRFITKGETRCHVRITIDGAEIVRQKSKSGNSYKLGRTEFTAVRTGVPEDISDALRIGDINYQGQHDPLFWITDSPGQVSKYLNEIINLGAIDKSLSKIGSIVRQKEAESKLIKERIKEAKEQVEELEWTVRAKRQFDRLVNMRSDMNERAARIAQIERCLSRRRQARKRHRNATQSMSALSELKSVADRGAELRDKTETVETMLKRANRAKQKVRKLTKSLKRAEAKFHKITKGRLCPICKKRM